MVPGLAWIQRDRSAILTVGNHVITRNNRIGVSHDGHRTWYLTIKDVRQGDAGTYMCQINTEIAVSQVGHVSVVVPPYIKDDMSSRDVRLQEGASVILACSARGSPVPTIKWRREDGSEIQVNGTTAMLEVPGPLLQLAQVSRTDMDAYLCIATNGIPPSVSKRIQVEVKFLPTVNVPHQLVGVPLNQEVTIECYIEAWPPGLNYWKRPNGIEVLHSDNKYEVKEIPGSQKYKTHMLLTIKSVTKADIGEYNCIANNSQGGGEQVVRVAASDPMPPNNRNALEKGYETKDGAYGKPSLSAVNWSKDAGESLGRTKSFGVRVTGSDVSALNSSTSTKDDYDDLLTSSQRTFKNKQRQAKKRLQHADLEHDHASLSWWSPVVVSLLLGNLLWSALLAQGREKGRRALLSGPRCSPAGGSSPQAGAEAEATGGERGGDMVSENHAEEEHETQEGKAFRNLIVTDFHSDSLALF
ncbi:lachesin-like [Penaeus chinensis]|uniref:lachesin-like n=1 Tax=Penaeus chinensis TaxID=139456 RepID=UPI001FB7FC0B|nr:lachesin-like [Penaeus chinensis]